MEHRGVEYTVGEIRKRVWKWTVVWEPIIVRTGEESSREKAVVEAERAIDRLLAVEQQRR
jgi:hypothetical protein